MSAATTTTFAPRTAWDLIGWDDGLVQVQGGRSTYDAVSYDDSRGGSKVRLQRLVVGSDGLRVINRYVDPDTQLVPADALARTNWYGDPGYQ